MISVGDIVFVDSNLTENNLVIHDFEGYVKRVYANNHRRWATIIDKDDNAFDVALQSLTIIEEDER